MHLSFTAGTFSALPLLVVATSTPIVVCCCCRKYIRRFFTALTLCLQPTGAVKYGDEQFGNQAGGKFWAFHSAGVSIVNPDTCLLEKTFNTDANGYSLPTSWSDGIYMESSFTTPDDNEREGYILINSGITRFDVPPYPDTGTGEVLILSTNPKEGKPVFSRIDVGGRPVHSYGVYTQNQFWTHSDADGHFYVIDLSDLSDDHSDARSLNHFSKKIVAHVNVAHHGKLLWDEDDYLLGTGYATSTGEQHIFVIDIANGETVSTFDYSSLVEDGTCTGTHAIAYSSPNRHLFVECSGGGGTLEIDVSDTRSLLFIKQWTNVTGSIYESPDESHIIVANKKDNKVHVFRPANTGQASVLAYEVDVPGHPSTPSFFPAQWNTADGFDDAADRVADYHVCMPLTENTNRNHLDFQGSVVCDYYGCSDAKTQQDVQDGICLYTADGRTFQEVAIGQMADVVSKEPPYFGACRHCENQDNYVDGMCTCTPYCGSCADEDYEASKSGVVCFDLNDVVTETSEATTLIKGAGAVLQGKPYSYSPQCGFGRTYRTHKRGGLYDASVANFPSNSLQIVNMRDFSFHCAVDLPGTPSRVVYVPPQGDEDTGSSSDSSSGLSTGGTAGIVIGATVAALVAMLFAFRMSKKSASFKQDSDSPEPTTVDGCEDIVS